MIFETDSAITFRICAAVRRPSRANLAESSKAIATLQASVRSVCLVLRKERSPLESVKTH
jgi:hypothetical protein